MRLRIQVGYESGPADLVISFILLEGTSPGLNHHRNCDKAPKVNAMLP